MDNSPKAPKGAKPKSEIMRENRKRKTAHGLKPVQVWVLAEDEAAIKAIEAESHKKAGYAV